MPTSPSTTSKNTTAFAAQAAISFGASLFAMLVGIYFMEADPWIKGFMALGTLHLTTSTSPSPRLLCETRLFTSLQASLVTERESRRITDVGARVFDNPSAYSLCVFEPRFAKCLTANGAGDELAGK